MSKATSARDMSDLAVRRRSCRRQSLTPQATSNRSLNVLNPLIGRAPVLENTNSQLLNLGTSPKIFLAADESGRVTLLFVLYLEPGIVHVSPVNSAHVIAAASSLRVAVSSKNRTSWPHGPG